MIIAAAQIKLYAPFVHSLKEKRMVVKSITSKVQNKFNASIAEVAKNDVHQTIQLGIACVSNDTVHADSTLDHVLNYIEDNTEAELMDIQREVR